MEFKTIGTPDEPFSFANPEAMELLSTITGPDRASAVPYIKIYEINPDGTPVNADSNGRPKAPINFKLMEPPSFGASADVKFRERPGVSLDSVVVKTQLSRGDYTIRLIDLTFVAHRPDAIYAEDEPGFDNWSSLLSPGSMHVLEYGWSGSSKNDLINGIGFSKDGSNVESRTQIIMLVSYYDFEFGPSGEVTIVVHAIENGANSLEKATIVEVPTASLFGTELINFYDKTGKDKRKNIQEAMKKLFDTARSEGKNKTKDGVTFKKVVDVLFADVIDGALKKAGYQETEMFLGMFSSKCYAAKPEFGGKMSGKSIGDFVLPLGEVTKIVTDLFMSGQQLNLIDVLMQLIEFVSSQDVWVQSEEGEDAHVPSLKIKIKNSTSNAGSSAKRKASVYIIDTTSQWIEFNSGDLLDPKTPRKDIVDKLKTKKIPLITLRHALSIVEDASFRIILDPKMKTDAVQRSIKAQRVDVVASPSTDLKAPRTKVEDIAFSSSIQGTITMLGNFVFDTFAVVWLEFGVPRWDGTFFVTEKVDTITPGDFTSQYTFLATGEDPLGTQGIRDAAAIGS